MRWPYLRQFADAIDSDPLKVLMDGGDPRGVAIRQALDDLEKFFASAPPHEDDIVEEVFGEVARQYWYRLGQEAKERDEALQNLIQYVRMLQIILVRIWSGKIDLGVRKAVELVVNAEKMYATSLELGGTGPRKLVEYAASLLGSSGTLLGIDQKDLERQVFGDKPDFRSGPRG